MLPFRWTAAVAGQAWASPTASFHLPLDIRAFCVICGSKTTLPLGRRRCQTTPTQTDKDVRSPPRWPLPGRTDVPVRLPCLSAAVVAKPLQRKRTRMSVLLHAGRSLGERTSPSVCPASRRTIRCKRAPAPPMPRLRRTRLRRPYTLEGTRSPRPASRSSAATMRAARSGPLVFASQPSTAFAFAGLPRRQRASTGRK